MFEGSAAQFLCIVETLSDSNRRTLLTAPPAPETEVEVLDVFAELFMAAQEIISGKWGSYILIAQRLKQRHLSLTKAFILMYCTYL